MSAFSDKSATADRIFGVGIGLWALHYEEFLITQPPVA